MYIFLTVTSTSYILLLDLPASLDFNVTQCCNHLVITWTIGLTRQSCPTTVYNIAISNNTVIVPANQTTYTHLISESKCGSTIQISLSATNVAGTGNATTTNHKFVCKRECSTTKRCILIPLSFDCRYMYVSVRSPFGSFFACSLVQVTILSALWQSMDSVYIK